MEEKLSSVTYRIGPRHTKVVHLNALKEFEVRGEQIRRLTVIAKDNTVGNEIDSEGKGIKLIGEGTCK